MTRAIAPRARWLLALIAALQLTALGSGRPELAVVTVPMAVFLAFALVGGEAPAIHARIELERERMLEGESCSATLTLHNSGRGAVQVEIELAHSDRLTVSPRGRLGVWLQADAERTIALELRDFRWGLLELGPVHLRVPARLTLVEWRGQIDARASARVFPTEQRLHELIAPARTQPFLGGHVARTRGAGIEFAEVRPFVHGDRARQINWRVTARRGAPYVNDRHPEHASDVVMLLDTFAEARTASAGTLDDAVRATATLARALLAQRDRVALVDLGGTLQWLEPEAGPRQLYRIIDVLLSSRIVFS